MYTTPDPADPPDLPDLGHGLLFGTYHPSRAGVRMTVVLNKLPQIIFGDPFGDPFGGRSLTFWRPKANIMEAEGRLNGGLGVETPGK